MTDTLLQPTPLDRVIPPLWGSHYDYDPSGAIELAWHQQSTRLGQCVSTRYIVLHQGSLRAVQFFERGIVSYKDGVAATHIYSEHGQGQ